MKQTISSGRIIISSVVNVAWLTLAVKDTVKYQEEDLTEVAALILALPLFTQQSYCCGADTWVGVLENTTDKSKF